MKSKPVQVIFAILFILIIGVLFSFLGQVKCDMNENEIKVSGTLSKSTTIQLDEIQSIEYIDELEFGKRSMGLGTSKMQIGSYKNEAYGKYKLYVYKSVEAYVVINYGDKVLVFNQSTIEDTEIIYNSLKIKLDTLR